MNHMYPEERKTHLTSISLMTCCHTFPLGFPLFLCAVLVLPCPLNAPYLSCELDYFCVDVMGIPG